MRNTASLKTILARCSVIKKTYRAANSAMMTIGYSLVPVLMARLRYRTAKGTWPDLKAPRTFDEKLLWLNFYWKQPLKARCGDKYTVRSYAAERGLGEYFPRLYGVYDRAADIDFDSLPAKFVLKCSHGCKFNIICRNKQDLDVKKVRKLLSRWLKTDYSRKYGELHYAAMEPRIICEEFLEEPGAELPSDYKVYCFRGKAHCTMSCTQRTLNGLAKYAYYDRDWKNRLPYKKRDVDTRQVPEPGAYQEMVRMAELLSEPFPFVRVDFYSINGRVLIGEMTFTPGGCVNPYATDQAEEVLGGLVRLPEKL